MTEPFERSDWWVDPVPGDGMGWTDYRAGDAANNRLVEGYRGRGLGVTIPPYHRRGSGAHYLLPPGRQEAWFRYYLYLDNWIPADSGKFPGFADVGRLTARGCNPSTTADPGWSARTMFFRPDTVPDVPSGHLQLGTYLYHVDQQGTCGDELAWDRPHGVIRQNRWYCIEGHVRMNTPGANDGVLEAWVDGQRVFSRNDIQYRRSGEQSSVSLRSMWLDVYFGGSSRINTSTLRMRLDQLTVRGDKRAGCLTRFTDTAGNVHRTDIEDLWRDRIVHGCSQNLYCPRSELTRAEMLALLDRYLRPPATDRDFFDDDNGHFAEGVLNRLAAAGIVKGCGRRSACPNEPVTRGQMAAFLRRSFDLPLGEGSSFRDARGHTFEGDIAAIESTGITKGCDDDRFCPDANTRRDQAASFMVRSIIWASAVEE